MKKKTFKRGEGVRNTRTGKVGKVTSLKPFAVKTKNRKGKYTNRITKKENWNK